jgi:ferredoxin-NADP reductase
MSLPPELAYVFGETSSPIYKRSRLISREMIAESTLALTLERPEGFRFEPGQNTIVSIPGKIADDLREFSFASAPHEKDLMLAMRVRDSRFKNACYALMPGDELTIRNPSGALWKETKKPQLWLSGGIGITPFRSILRESLHNGGPFPVLHLHSDHSLATAPFLAEFEAHAKKNNAYQFVLTLTREKSLGHEIGRITEKTIESYAPHLLECDCTIVGTTSFVGIMRSALTSLKVPALQIRTERFEGYTTHGA